MELISIIMPYYKKKIFIDQSIQSVDFKTGEYEPLIQVRFDCYRIAKDYQNLKVYDVKKLF